MEDTVDKPVTEPEKALLCMVMANTEPVSGIARRLCMEHDAMRDQIAKLAREREEAVADADRWQARWTRGAGQGVAAIVAREQAEAERDNLRAQLHLVADAAEAIHSSLKIHLQHVPRAVREATVPTMDVLRRSFLAARDAAGKRPA